MASMGEHRTAYRVDLGEKDQWKNLGVDGQILFVQTCMFWGPTGCHCGHGLMRSEGLLSE